MPQLSLIKYRTRNPETLRQFYVDVLGMRQRLDGSIGYSDQEAGLMFEAGQALYTPSPESVYWKITLSVPNIELACEQLTERGVKVTQPDQFLDIGYLAHFSDPNGFQIELIDHEFKGNRRGVQVDEKLLGGGPRINLLTLRTNNINEVKLLAKKLGMSELAIMPVESRGFTLYFYGFEEYGVDSQARPNPDLCALGNRTWVYQRPYTVLEVLHREQQQAMDAAPETGSGYLAALVSGLESSVEVNDLLIHSEIAK